MPFLFLSRYVVVPRSNFYYLNNGETPSSEKFLENMIPDRATWSEYDIAFFARRVGCEYTIHFIETTYENLSIYIVITLNYCSFYSLCGEDNLFQIKLNLGVFSYTMNY